MCPTPCRLPLKLLDLVLQVVAALLRSKFFDGFLAAVSTGVSAEHVVCTMSREVASQVDCLKCWQPS